MQDEWEESVARKMYGRANHKGSYKPHLRDFDS